MLDILNETLGLVERSAIVGWPDEQPIECARILRGMIAFVNEPRENPCPAFAKIQFAPTGPIQEIAMANGWHDEYLRLAEAYDEAETSGRFFSPST